MKDTSLELKVRGVVNRNNFLLPILYDYCKIRRKER